MSNLSVLSTSAKVRVYAVYGVLIIPVGLIVLLNKLISPFSPTLSFGDLESLV